MKYQLLVFDWDGTLYDSGAYIVFCAQKAAKELGFHIPKASDITHSMGLSFEIAVTKYMPDITADQVKAFTNKFRENFLLDGIDTPILFEGAIEVLKTLHQEGYWLSVATGKSRESLEKDFSRVDIKDLFLTTRCASETISKPNPQMLLEIIEELGVVPEKVLMIGDSSYDLEMAANAKVDALGVTYGVHEREHLSTFPNKGFIASINDLPGWLKDE